MKFSKIQSPGTFTRIACLIMAVAMAVSLVGCGVDITSVGLPTDIVLEKGETQQLNIEYGTDNLCNLTNYCLIIQTESHLVLLRRRGCHG